MGLDLGDKISYYCIEWIPSCCIRFSVEAKPLKRTWRLLKPEMNW